MKNNASLIEGFKACLGIGIDVSKAELVVVGLTRDKPHVVRVNNTLEAVRRFVQCLGQTGYEGKIICESTGHYHLKLVLACQECGVQIIVLNPLQSSKHAKAKIRKTRTDPTDGLTLATMCVTEPNLPPPVQLTPAKVLIQLKIGQLASLEKLLQKMQRSVKQYEQTYAELKFELSVMQTELGEHYRSLKRVQKAMVEELEQLLSDQQGADQSVNRLNDIPGYSKVVCGLVGQFNRQVKGADAWVAYVGLDVSVRESGTFKGRGKLTKRGHPYLRKRLFQAAWGACMTDDDVRAYYDQLKAQGRQHTEALCMIARKLLRIAYHIVVREKVYDPKIAFSMPRA